MRLFVAAELPQPLLEALSETSALLRGRVTGRYVAPDSFHLTLAFLGEVAGSQVADACEALDVACAGQPPIKVALGPLGSFGRKRKATLWQGFSMGVDELGGLAGDVREALAEHGLDYDPLAFAPHVTLMRAADLSAGMLPPVYEATGRIGRVSLFRSDLSGPRPRYEALHTVELVEVEPEELQAW